MTIGLSLRRAAVSTRFLTLLITVVLAACSGGEQAADGREGSADAGAHSAVAVGQSQATRKASGTLAEQAARARWSEPVSIPIVPAAAANLPDGRVVFWSAEDRFGFWVDMTLREDLGRTYTVLYDPATGSITERLVAETRHNMFCPGTTNLADGRIMVNGGLSTVRTSIFDGNSNNWSESAPMGIARGYQSNTIFGDGSVLTLGGSWSGGIGNKHGEIWNANSGWRRLPGVPIDPMLSTDLNSDYGMDSHLWLLPTGNGRILHAGPGRQMNWIDVRGDGRVTSAGTRGDDSFSISGNTVMYDLGRVLKVGGSSGYENQPSNANSFIIDTTSGVANVRRINSMSYPRTFHNSVVLPNGQVIIIGGQTFSRLFSDANSVLIPELFDPATESFTQLPSISIPRNYHSVALLLPDGRVISGGGGLCADCTSNHPDFQILAPPYLFNADGSWATRPVITNSPRTAGYGTNITVTTDSPVSSMAIVRLSSTTHTVNNDQRRLPLNFQPIGGNRYSVDIPSNPGWALPGEYMLFVMNADGTPSVSRLLRIEARDGLWLVPPDELFGTVGTSVDINLQASTRSGAGISFRATGLPDGLNVDAGSGRITGSPTRMGTYLVTLMASSGDQTVSWQVPWTINDLGNVRFVRFDALSEAGGGPWASIAELELFDEQGRTLPRAGWSASASTSETVFANAGPFNAIDGNPATFWHSQWSGGAVPPPHRFVIDLGSAQRVGGFRYTPRSDSNNGSIAGFRVYLSADGNNWGSPVSTGDLRELGLPSQVKSVYFGNLLVGRPASQSSVGAGGTAAATRAVDGNTNGSLAAGSVSATNSENNPWWEADLGSNTMLQTIRLWNRTDCCSDQLANFYILMSATPMTGRSLQALLNDPSVRNLAFSGQAGPVTTFSSAIQGRYLRVQINGTAALQLAEVQAYGYPTVNRAPVIATPNPTTTRAGTSAALQLSANDADGDRLSWSASGLPTGLSLDSARGLISGVPTAPGNFNVELGVSDGNGGNNNATFVWTITAQELTVSPVAAPAIVRGGTVVYNAAASGTDPQFRWNFGDGSPETAYSRNNVGQHVYAQPGIYTVTLSVRDAAGTVITRSFLQAVAGPSNGLQANASGNTAYETRANLSGRVWVVNPDNHSVSVIDAASNTRLTEITVGLSPHALAVGPDGQIWVTNRDDSSVSVIDAASLTVVRTIALQPGSQPYGIVRGRDGVGFVALEALGRVLRLSAQGAVLGQIEIPGARHLALSPDGSRLLVSRYITAPQPGEGTARVLTSLNGAPTGGEVFEINTTSLTQNRRFVLRHSDHADSSIAGRGVPNYLGPAAIAPDGASAWVPSKQDNIQRGMLRDGSNLNFQNTVRAVSSRLDLVAGVEDYAGRVDHDNSGVASHAVFHPAGAYVLVSLESSRQVAIIDAAGRQELFRFDTGRAPQGLSVSPDGRRLFVHNFTDRTLGVYDLGPLVDYGTMQVNNLTTVNTVAAERLPAAVLRGKQLFYDARDPRLARDQYLSCASCHNGGGQDGRTWDLTGFGEGLRNTIALNGRGAPGFGMLHWSGNFDEVQDFEGQIRALAGGAGLVPDAQFTPARRSPLGERLAGVNADLDALAAYVNSLVTVPASPYRLANDRLTPNGAAGKALFEGLGCASCHGGPQFAMGATAGELRNIGTLKPSSGARLGAALTGIDVPSLRDAWSNAPYLHDGSAATLSEAIAAHNLYNLRAADTELIARYVREIGSQEAPPVSAAMPATVACANRGGVCVIPSGSIATVYFKAEGGPYIARSGVTGSLGCDESVFGDPQVGANKSCSYSVLGTSSGLPSTGTGPGGGFALVTADQAMSTASAGTVQGVIELQFSSTQAAPVYFSCSGLPANARCDFDPAVVTPDASGLASTRLTIVTGISRVAAAGGGIAGIGIAFLFVGALGSRKPRPYLNRGAGLLFVIALVLAGCGGGGGGGGGGSASQETTPGGSPGGNGTATPPGTYVVRVTATNGVVTQSMDVRLTVR